MIRLALFQPDIPQNTGSVIRLAACFGLAVDIIEPAGFVWDDKRLRRSGMDYSTHVDLARHPSWNRFADTVKTENRRLVLFTTQGASSYLGFSFSKGDILLFGRESAGVPPEVHAAAHARVCIPLVREARSLNLAQAAAIGTAEALRKTGGFPPFST